MLDIKIINKSKNPLPKYETEGAAGCDVRAELSHINEKFLFNASINGNYESITIQPLGRALIPTGLFMAIPKGYEIQVRPRSGLALKKGLTLANCVGTIDSDYRNEAGVICINLSNEPITIPQGERICQFVLSKVEQIDWVVVDELDNTNRTGGFGSTGTK